MTKADEVKLLVSDSDHYRHLIRLARRAKKVLISTFGVFYHRRGGEWNGAYHLCETLPEGSRVLVGVNDHVPSIWMNQMENAGAAAGRFQHVEMRVTFEWHAKFSLFEMEDGTYESVVGSRNFTPSKWVDVTLAVSGVKLHKKILAVFNQGWRGAQPAKMITGEELEALREAQVARRAEQIVDIPGVFEAD